jgi:hypothetical protein
MKSPAQLAFRQSRQGKSPGLSPAQTSRHADGVRLPKVEAGFILITDGRFVSGIRFHQKQTDKNTNHCNHAVDFSSRDTSSRPEISDAGGNSSVG